MLTSLWPRFNPQILFLVTVLTPGEEGGGYFTGFSSLPSHNHKSKTLNSNLEYFCLFSFPPPFLSSSPPSPIASFASCCVFISSFSSSISSFQMVIYEAARALVNLKNLKSRDLCPAISGECGEELQNQPLFKIIPLTHLPLLLWREKSEFHLSKGSY